MYLKNPSNNIYDSRKKIQEKNDELEKLKLQLTEAQKGYGLAIFYHYQKI